MELSSCSQYHLGKLIFFGFLYKGLNSIDGGLSPSCGGFAQVQVSRSVILPSEIQNQEYFMDPREETGQNIKNIKKKIKMNK